MFKDNLYADIFDFDGTIIFNTIQKNDLLISLARKKKFLNLNLGKICLINQI